jgi:hypothetical protein
MPTPDDNAPDDNAPDTSSRHRVALAIGGFPRTMGHGAAAAALVFHDRSAAPRLVAGCCWSSLNHSRRAVAARLTKSRTTRSL